MAVARGTTPTFELTFTDAQLDLTQMENVYVTFQSGRNTLTKKGEDLTIRKHLLMGAKFAKIESSG